MSQLEFHKDLCRGLLLFLLFFINDISEGEISIKRLFAGGTSFGVSGTDPGNIKSIIDLDLAKLDDWSEKCLMKLNPDEIEVLKI